MIDMTTFRPKFSLIILKKYIPYYQYVYHRISNFYTFYHVAHGVMLFIMLHIAHVAYYYASN